MFQVAILTLIRRGWTFSEHRAWTALPRYIVVLPRSAESESVELPDAALAGTIIVLLEEEE